MIRKILLSLSVVTGLLLQNAEAGIDYQWSIDGAGHPVSLTGVGGGNGNWQPVPSGSTGGTAIKWAVDYSAGTLTVVDQSPSGSYRIDVSKSGSKLKTVTSSFTAGDLNASHSTVLYSGGAGASGYNSSGTNYFGWAAYNTTGGDSLEYLGWAEFVYLPDPPGSNFTDSLRILDWAYITSDFSNGILPGQSKATGSVPEPASMAVIGLVGLAAGLARRRRA